MAKLSSRPHRTKPAGSYVKPDWKGYVKRKVYELSKRVGIITVQPMGRTH